MDDNTFTNWRKSTRSSGGDNCVEVATTTDTIGVRDSKDPHGTVLKFNTTGWADFITGVRNGEFDL